MLKCEHVAWWAPELMRIPRKLPLCRATSLIADYPADGLLSELPLYWLSAVFPWVQSTYKLFFFSTCLSWNTLPFLRFSPRERWGGNTRQRAHCRKGVQQPRDYKLKLSIPAARSLGGCWSPTYPPVLRSEDPAALIQISPTLWVNQYFSSRKIKKSEIFP